MYVARILLCERCKFGEKIFHSNLDNEFFLRDCFFIGAPCRWASDAGADGTAVARWHRRIQVHCTQCCRKFAGHCDRLRSTRRHAAARQPAYVISIQQTPCAICARRNGKSHEYCTMAEDVEKADYDGGDFSWWNVVCSRTRSYLGSHDKRLLQAYTKDDHWFKKNITDSNSDRILEIG